MAFAQSAACSSPAVSFVAVSQDGKAVTAAVNHTDNLRRKTRRNMSEIKHVYQICPRKDHRGVDLISDALPFGRLWYT
jgi:hypothetical protein